MRRQSGLSDKLNNVMFFLAGVLTVVIIGILAVGIRTMAQNNRTANQDYQSSVKVEEKPVKANENEHETWQSNDENTNNKLGGEKWAEGVIEHNGHKYKYNSDQKIYLLMGIDHDGKVEKSKDFVSGGQSDAMFLLVADDEKRQMKIVSINRNCMTNIQVCDSNGTSMGDMEAQICVQHGFGDGQKLSCTRTVKAVSDMFYNLPISGYIAFNLGAINSINSVVGGVQVQVLEDMKVGDGDFLKKGEIVTLTDEQAYMYLRGRDLNEFGSATGRLRRQEQYINNYIMTVKNSSGVNRAKVENIYNALEDYMVTSVDFTELVTNLIEYDYTENDMYTVPGTTKNGKQFEEYYIEEEEFVNMILEVFYRNVD